MTTTQPKKICAGFEPIPGYVLEEILGRGGFGEVWRASAPGGLKKAVKFVFGTQDQSRASRELRSLERIKGVQHPFLLTLERFEAIDDQLVIVSELADCSLEDVFKRHRDSGSCGIPREKLISHLHDTSDALDYLHERYQLQHLDIKPANLLLVGGHVKVADFGLLKDLRETECSVVGGLTPIYAPPEIFDGRPSMHSDQYSLAVMYQELLTGTRPFGGRTIAQLATQHVHSAPNLEPLPPSDRPVVAKALEKNPERRFPSCLAFVEALKNTHGRSTKVSAGTDELGSADTKLTLDGVDGAGPIEDLPQLSTGAVNAKSKAQHHAIVIALGGTGAECLRELRRRTADLHSASPLDLHSVLIDTDMSTIHSMRVGEASDKIPACNAIYAPLRTAHEYRQDGTERLRTISRRWIYNVPRSGSTEGMRPLGRLALVDHGPMVTKRLTEALERLASAAGDSSPSVYVVGSLNGGTASGMFIDVVHLLRHLLDETGLVDTPILSMLSTAPMQGDPSRPLGLHDAQAAIMEMRHFLQAGNGYPGDVGAGWPSVPAARTPLRDVYLVAGSTSRSLAPSPSATITDYIWSDATGAGGLLASARKLEVSEESSIVPPSIRSVGVVALGDSNQLERRVLAPIVVRELLIQWLGLPSKAREAAASLSDRIMRRIGFSAETIVQETSLHLSELQREQVTQASPFDALTPMVESMAADGALRSVVTEVLGSLRREITVGLNDRRADVTTIIECLKRICERSADWSMQLRRSVTDDNDEQHDRESPLTIATRLIASHQIEQIRDELQTLQGRLERFATMLAMSIVQASQSQQSDSNPWDEMPEETQSRFSSVVLQLHGESINRFLVRSLDEQGIGVDAGTMVNQLIEITIPLVTSMLRNNHAAKLSREGDSEFVDEDLSATISSTIAFQGGSHAQASVTQALDLFPVPRPTAEPLSIEDALVAVKPALLAFGGLQRLIMVVGSQQERSQLEPQIRDLHEGALTVAVIPGSSPKLIHEAQQVELTSILSRLTILNGSNSQVTGRLASRTDVTW